MPTLNLELSQARTGEQVIDAGCRQRQQVDAGQRQEDGAQRAQPDQQRQAQRQQQQPWCRQRQREPTQHR